MVDPLAELGKEILRLRARVTELEAQVGLVQEDNRELQTAESLLSGEIAELRAHRDRLREALSKAEEGFVELQGATDAILEEAIEQNPKFSLSDGTVESLHCGLMAIRPVRAALEAVKEEK